tara:strand:- start:29 stop:214 length:186 start_codon:yes stop_codon:yes gene_type:complete
MDGNSYIFFTLVQMGRTVVEDAPSIIDPEPFENGSVGFRKTKDGLSLDRKKRSVERTLPRY